MYKFFRILFKNPNFIFLVAVLTSALILLTVSSRTYRVVDEVLHNIEHSNKVRGKVESIRLYNEILTQSAILAISTGDIKWKNRYLFYEQKIDSAIYELATMDPDHTIHQIMNIAHKTNGKLVEIEHNALELSSLNKRDEALKVITSNEYETQKEVFLKSLNTFINNHVQDTDIEYKHLLSEVNYSKWLFRLVILIFILTWIQIALFMRKNQLKIINYNKELEIQIHEKNKSELKVKEANIQIEKTNKELLKLNAEKDKFLSIIAHDLRGPYNSIIGLSELLITKVKDKEMEAIEKFSNIINLSSKRAMDLLTTLMEWVNSQTGRIKYTPSNFNLSNLADEIIQLLNDTAIQKSITIEKKYTAKNIVYADKHMISTILRNLISNAIKFTNIGGLITIEIAKNESEFLVSVSDNGIGIPENTIEKLYRIDENISTYGTKNEKGTGLGLILCKEFVEKNNGQLVVKSEIDKGSEFSFTIPILTKSVINSQEL